MMVRIDHCIQPVRRNLRGKTRLTLLCICGLFTACAEPPDENDDPVPPRIKVSEPMQSAPAMRVYVDPDTGELLPPPAAANNPPEIEKDQPEHENVRESLHEPVTWPDGTVSVRPKPSSVPYHGIRTCPDGTIAEQCAGNDPKHPGDSQ